MFAFTAEGIYVKYEHIGVRMNLISRMREARVDECTTGSDAGKAASAR